MRKQKNGRRCQALLVSLTVAAAIFPGNTVLAAGETEEVLYESAYASKAASLA